jgi:hypothetical protein
LREREKITIFLREPLALGKTKPDMFLGSRF